MPKRVEIRKLARDDVETAVDHYHAEGGLALARRFIDALEVAIQRLGKYPLTGSLRYAYELDIPELRTWTLPGFPYLVFYIDRSEHVDVWRVLHARRDLPASFSNDE